jgi:hypothetical protein
VPRFKGPTGVSLRRNLWLLTNKEEPMSDELYREVHKCARRGTDQIEHCKCLIERKIEEDKMALLQRRDEGVSDASIGRFWHHLEITLANTFRYTLLSGVCAVVEECVNAITENLVSDEKEREKAKNKAGSAVKATKGWTNWLQTGVGLIITDAKIPPTANFESDVEQFTDIITLRNCISHAWGKIASADYPDQVREAVKRLGLVEVRENTELARISSDGYLVLGRDMVSYSIFPAVEIVDFLCTAMVAYEKRKSP